MANIRRKSSSENTRTNRTTSVESHRRERKTGRFVYQRYERRGIKRVKVMVVWTPMVTAAMGVHTANKDSWSLSEVTEDERQCEEMRMVSQQATRNSGETIERSIPVFL